MYVNELIVLLLLLLLHRCTQCTQLAHAHTFAHTQMNEIPLTSSPCLVGDERHELHRRD